MEKNLQDPGLSVPGNLVIEVFPLRLPLVSGVPNTSAWWVNPCIVSSAVLILLFLIDNKKLNKRSGHGVEQGVNSHVSEWSWNWGGEDRVDVTVWFTPVPQAARHMQYHRPL